MQQVVYTGIFFCELCHEEIAMPVYGDATLSFTSEEELECIDWCRHFHWIDNHRTCAVCGKIVLSSDLELAVNNGEIKIHSEYTDEYKRVKRGQHLSPLLIVHEKCIKTYGKSSENN